MGFEAHYNKDGILLIRKSMIEDFTFCPYRFKKTWIDNIAKRPNQIMLIGTRFHDFANTFFDYCGAYPPEYWDHYVPKEFIEEEQAMALWFINYERDRLEKLELEGKKDLWFPLMREHKMKSEALYLEGTCDRIDWYNRDKEQVIIVEYKTGKSINDVLATRQLAFYSILWQDTMGSGEVAGLRVINPRMQIIKDYRVDNWQTNRVMRDIVTLRDAIRNNKFPAKCSEIKLAMCRACSPIEAGVSKGDIVRFTDHVDKDRDFHFTDIYKEEV
jgi:hypothetical protein